MIFVCANLSKGDLIAFGDVQADVFAHRVDLRVKDDTSILGRTHDVVDQCRDIVPLMTIVAHNSDNTISEKAEASFEESDPQRFKRLLLRFESLQCRHYGMKLMAYTLINVRWFCAT